MTEKDLSLHGSVFRWLILCFLIAKITKDNREISKKGIFP